MDLPQQLYRLTCAALIVGWISSMPVTVNADVVDAASGSPADVRAAVDAANEGDTVQIPAGTFAFLGTVIIDKSITVRGAGQSETVLAGANLTNEGMIRVTADNVTISDMTLRGRPQGSGRIQDVGLSFRSVIDFVAQRLTLQDFGAVGISAGGADTRGVISHCRFIDIYRPEIGNLGYGVYVGGGGALNWERPMVLGSQEFVFVEDSYFTGNRHSIASSQGSRYVFRHNESVNTTLRSQHVDAHGMEYGAAVGSRGYEIYNNVISGGGAGMSIRGGDGVIFGNMFSAEITSGINLVNRTDGSSTCDYPNAYQTTDLHVWDNIRDGMTQSLSIWGSTACLFEEGRDYHYSMPAAYVPYSYPHPLVTGTPPVITPPPGNTCVVDSSPSGIVPVEISVSGHDGNVPCNLVDDDFATRWSAEGDGEWAQLDLGAMTTVNGFQAAFYRGDERASRFDLQVSRDGAEWTGVLTDAASSGSSLDLEVFAFPEQSARYVRYVGHGNSIAGNDWNSVAEMRVLFEASTGMDGGGGQLDGGAGDGGGSSMDGGPGSSMDGGGSSMDGGTDVPPDLDGTGCAVHQGTEAPSFWLALLLGALGLRSRARRRQ